MSKFSEFDINNISENVFKKIGNEWMLITAGTEESFNCMTASWGGMGILWNKPVIFTFIRPTRHTFQFTEKNDFSSISFFSEKFKPVLQICGTKSGKDIDKMHGIGLIPAFTTNGTPYYQEAEWVFDCKKMYFQDIDPSHFLNPEIEQKYPLHDYHRMYVSEIIQILKKDSI